MFFHLKTKTHVPFQRKMQELMFAVRFLYMRSYFTKKWQVYHLIFLKYFAFLFTILESRLIFITDQRQMKVSGVL